MKKIVLTTILIACQLFYLFGQQELKPFKIGKVPDSFIHTQLLEGFDEEEAVVILNKGEAKIEYVLSSGWSIKYKYHKVIKVQSKDGYSHADISIPTYKFSNRKESVKRVKGITYNLENNSIEKTSLDNSSIFEEEVNSNFFLTKINMPNVKEGSVIEISYEISSTILTYLRGWQFQSTIPTLLSEYEVEIPEFFTYSENHQGFLDFDERRTSNGRENINYVTTSKNKMGNNSNYDSRRVSFNTDKTFWSIKNAPAIKEEKFMDNPISYVSSVEFTLRSVKYPDQPQENVASGWDGYSEELLKSRKFGGQIEPSNFSSLAVRSFIGDETDPNKIIDLTMDHVNEKVKWDGEFGVYANNNVEKAYESGSGNVAEINLLLTLLLRQAGLVANPVVTSTRNKGYLNLANPILHKLNYTLVEVALGEELIYLDATDPSLTLGFIPIHALNLWGYRIAEKGVSGIVKIQNSKENSTIKMLNLSLNEENKINGSVNSMFQGYSGSRKKISLAKSGEDTYVKNLLTEDPDFEIRNPSWTNHQTRHKNLIEKYDFVASDGIEIQGDIILWNPLNLDVYTKSPFNEEQRIYPIDFIYPQKQQYIINIAIPEGYEVVSLPENMALALPENIASFTYGINVLGGQTIQLKSSLNIVETFYEPAQYLLVREFFERVSEVQQQNIVLKKSS